jgi:hypothetical protein
MAQQTDKNSSQNPSFLQKLKQHIDELTEVIASLKKLIGDLGLLIILAAEIGLFLWWLFTKH